jgi:hypothetical protein
VDPKKDDRTHHTKLVFLHLVRSTGHVVWSMHPGRETSLHCFSCSGGSNVGRTKRTPGQVMTKLCFCIRCNLWVT